MSRRLIVRPEAESDIAAAAQWHDGLGRGLSLDLRSAFNETFLAIENDPERYPRVYRDLRRDLLRRFQYRAFYLNRAKATIVLAVLHTSRNPKLWRMSLRRHD